MRTLECRCIECGRAFGIPLEANEQPKQGDEFPALCPYCETPLILAVRAASVPAAKGEIVIPLKVRP